MSSLWESVKAMSDQINTWEPIGIRWGLIGDAFYKVSSTATISELSHFLTEKPPASDRDNTPPPAAVIPQVPTSAYEIEMPPPLPTRTPKKRVRIPK